MYDTAGRVKLIQQRAGQLQQKRDKRSLRALILLCLTLALGLVRTFAMLTGGQRTAFVQEMSGATLMYEDAGAYVLVGVLSFTAAVIITILCLRHRHKVEKSQNENSDQQDPDVAEDTK